MSLLVFWFGQFQSSIFDLHQHFRMRKAEEVLPSDWRKDTHPDRLVSRPRCWQLHQHAERHSGRTGDERREASNWKWQLKLNSGAVSSNRRSEVSGVCRSLSPQGFSPSRTSTQWHFSDYVVFPPHPLSSSSLLPLRNPSHYPRVPVVFR